MSSPPPSRTNTSSERKWLPWVIGIAILLVLAWWARGCGKMPEAGMTADSTQSMMPPDTTPAPAAVPEPAPVEAATPAPVTPTATPPDTTHAMTAPHTPSRADTIRAPAKPLPPPEPTGPGAMGGRGAPGKKPPATTP